VKRALFECPVAVAQFWHAGVKERGSAIASVIDAAVQKLNCKPTGRQIVKQVFFCLGLIFV